MKLNKRLLNELQNRLKIGSRRGVHLNAIPGNSLYKFDLHRLSSINKNLPSEFIGSLLKDLPMKFRISWKENVEEFGSLFKEEQSQLVKITRSFENLINQTETIESEKGINTFGFGFPLLIRRDQADGKLTVAPILIWSLRISRSKEFNTWIINRGEEDPIYINELLINHLQQDAKVQIDQIASEMLDDGLIDKKELTDICFDLISSINTTVPANQRELFDQNIDKIKAIPDKKKCEDLVANSNNSVIEFGGLFSIFEVQKQSIIDEYEDLLGKEEVTLEQNDLKDNYFQPITSVETDPSQQNILNSLKSKRNLLIQGPPGTGKSQSLTAILINALENHKKTIVVCEKNTALEVLHKALKERKLDHNCIVIKDIQKDRKIVVDSVRGRIDGFPYKSSGYEYSKCPLENLTIKANNLITTINTGHKNIGEKIFEENNWTKTVGLFLSNRKCLNHDFDLKIDKNTLSFTFREFQELLDILDKGESLYLKYAPNESKSFLNSINLKGTNHYNTEQAIKDDFNEYRSRIYDDNSLINKLLTIHSSNSEFKDIQTTSSFWYLFSSIFSNKKKTILRDQRLIAVECNNLIDKIINDGWVQIDVNRKEFPSIIEEIKRILDLYDNYFSNQDDLFENEFYWFKLYNELNENNKKIVNALKTRRNWNITFSVFFLNTILARHSNKLLPTNDEDLKELASVLSKVGKAQLKFIKDFWFSKQMEAAYKFSLTHDDLSIENLYNKRSSHLHKRHSLRQIVRLDPNLFTTFFPIVLTTPDVCSNLFKSLNGHFDIVLFDEASQLRLEDNLPAILKGKQVIISGDEHQMPPSNYFSKVYDGIVEDEDEEEEDEPLINRDDILLSCESLLDFANELSFEKKHLDFHYRSKHPYLIDFSNHAFYNKRLKPLPSNEDYIPIKHYQLDGTFSDHSNEVEAEAVLSIIEKNIQRLPSGKYPSVGVATFNISHRNLILNKIRERQKFEKYAAFNKKMAELESNGFFVKNLENIQGDERDIIILSTTYGINKDGKFILKGPLIQKKGYKLLNVIITRAKYKVYVCTSIPEKQYLNFKEYLTVEKSNNRKAVFYAYIAYAKAVSEEDHTQRQYILESLLENSNISQNETVEPDSDLESPFEEEVYNVLKSHFDSSKIIKQYKIAEFRIDLVFDPQIEGGKKIAIECDGASYHSSQEAYLYDYYRQKILEDQGFIFYRIWSTNWWHNYKRESEKLIQFIQTINNQQARVLKKITISESFDDQFVPTHFQRRELFETHSKIEQSNKKKKIQKKDSNKTWETSSNYWSENELPGYSYAPKHNAWYKKKLEIDSDNKIYSEKIEIPVKILETNVGNIVKLKYINIGKIQNIKITDDKSLNGKMVNDIRLVYFKEPLAESIKGKSVGEIAKVGMLDTYVEILEIQKDYFNN